MQMDDESMGIFSLLLHNCRIYDSEILCKNRISFLYFAQGMRALCIETALKNLSPRIVKNYTIQYVEAKLPGVTFEMSC